VLLFDGGCDTSMTVEAFQTKEEEFSHQRGIDASESWRGGVSLVNERCPLALTGDLPTGREQVRRLERFPEAVSGG
jgi:hypothetical protein